METPLPDAPCWKRIGTLGDRSCPELPAMGHCRNCPVFSAAGRELLNRALPEGYREEWTERLEGGKEAEQVETGSVIIFRLRQEWLALKTVFFQQAADTVLPHSIPLRTGEVFKGIVNVNGELLLCVDLAALVGITGGDAAEAGRKVYPRLVVISRNSERFAFPADEVFGVHRFPLSLIQEVPATISHSLQALTAGILPWGEKRVGILDEDKLFDALNRSLAP
jgi:chemotaxis-related protein WspD